MVIQASKINPSTLPSAVAAGRKHLPRRPAVYFVLDGENILYIGQSSNLFKRFVNHETWKEMGSIDRIRIAWVECEQDDLSKLESALISRFRPDLNSNFSTTDKIPSVTDGVLNVAPDGIRVESSQWFQWVNTVQSFRYCPKTIDAPFTARKEKEQYWYGYRKVKGKLRKRYIGKNEDLTIAHLDDIARVLDTGEPLTREAVLQVTQKAVTEQLSNLVNDDITQLWQAINELRDEVAALGK